MKNRYNFFIENKLTILIIVLTIIVVPIINYFSNISINRLSNHYKKREKIVNYLKNYKIEKDRLNEFLSEIPTYNETLKFLNFIIDNGKKNSVKIFSIQSRKIKDNKFIKKLSMEIPIEGKYEKIKKFIYDIEKSPMPLYIDSIENNPDSILNGRLSLTISLILLYKEEKDEK